MFNKKNILVTGGAGFVGVNLIKRLLDTGANVRATLHKKDAVIRNEKIDYVRCDLLNQEDCKKICQDIDYVFLCAANTSGAAVMEKTPLVHLTPNVIMNVSMLEAAHKAGVKKTLFISSNTVYPLSDAPMKEDDVTNQFYEKYFIVAWMKRFTEIVCEMYSNKIKNPMKTVIVRPANIYGPYDDFEWETSHVIPALIRKVVERHSPIEVWGDGSDIKDFIYIDDFIEGMLLCMEKLDGFEPLNIASGKQYVIKDILKTIIEIDDFQDANIVYNTSKPTMIPKRLIDTSKAKSRMGFEARISMKEGLTKTIKWYRTTI